MLTGVNPFLHVPLHARQGPGNALGGLMVGKARQGRLARKLE